MIPQNEAIRLAVEALKKAEGRHQKIRNALDFIRYGTARKTVDGQALADAGNNLSAARTEVTEAIEALRPLLDQTSEARKAALAKFDGLIRNIHRISKLAFIPLHVDFDKDTALVRAALRQPDTSEAVREWQPIETAPRDGRYIILHRSKQKRGTSRKTDVIFGRYSKNCWVTSTCHYETDVGFTHWMPLPEAPAVIAAMKGVDHGN